MISICPLRCRRMGALCIGSPYHLQNKRASKSPLFVLKPSSLGQPGLHGVRTVFRFPLLQRFVVPAFGFYDLASLWVFVDFHLTWLTAARFRLGSRSTATGLWVEQIDDVFEAVAVLGQEGTELGFEFNFRLQASITF